jgi:hypothetical protein
MITASGLPDISQKVRMGSIGEFLGSVRSTTRMRKKFEIGLFADLILILFLLVLKRIHYGVDLTDEAYNMAIPGRFSLGIPLSLMKMIHNRPHRFCCFQL